MPEFAARRSSPDMTSALSIESSLLAVRHKCFDDPAVYAAIRITHCTLESSCSACVDTLQIWTEAYAAEAGNMALPVLPFGEFTCGRHCPENLHED